MHEQSQASQAPPDGLSDAVMRRALAASGVGLWVLDVAADRLIADARYAALHSCDPAQLRVGMPFGACLHAVDDLDRLHVAATFDTATRSDEPFEVEYRVRDVAGTRRWVAARGRAERDLAGGVRLVGTVSEITARRHAEERLWRLQRSSAALAQVEGLAATARATTEAIRAVLGAHIVVLRFVVPGGLATEATAIAPGGDEATLRGFHFVPDDAHNPAAESLRERRVRLIRSLDELEPYPELLETARRTGTQAVIYLPVMHDGQAIAVISAAFPEPQAFSEADLAIALTFADRCGAALERARLFEALRDSEERFRTLADAVPQIVYVSRGDGSGLDYVNDRWMSYTGLSYEETLRDSNQAIHPEDLPGALAVWREALRTGEPYEVEMRLRRADGVYRWFLARSVPVYDAEGTVVRWFGTSTDIHERRQAEDDARLLSDLSERVRLSDDPQGLVAAVARRLGEHLRVERCYVMEVVEPGGCVIRDDFAAGLPSIAGSYTSTFMPDSMVAAINQGTVIVVDDAATDPRTEEVYAQAFAPAGVRSYVLLPLLRDGRWVAGLVVAAARPRRWFRREMRLLETVAERLWVAVEKLRLEHALRQQLAQTAAVALENQRLYEQEQAARAQAEEANRLKDEFLATVSHELRTPLTAFLGYGQLLQARKRDEAYVARVVEKMMRSATAQAQLIEDLLDVSRVIGGKLRIEPRPIDLAAVIRAAIDAVRPTIEAKALRLETTFDAAASVLLGDPNRLQQVIWNLLSNAAKFTPPGGTIGVELRAEGSFAVISVSDTGEGIAAAFLPHVFERFRQADSSSLRSHGGLGLGLAIVRHLVELHGGTVYATSEGPGLGATFTVRLPLAERSALDRPEREPAAWQGACPSELDGLRVLVVDDQPAILELLAEVLGECGAVVESCNSAAGALRLLQSWRPDLLISDIAMPYADGYWLIGQLRAMTPEEGGSIPAIALTAYVRVEERTRVLAAGFQLYLPKPVDPDELLAVVASLVRG